VVSDWLLIKNTMYELWVDKKVSNTEAADISEQWITRNKKDENFSTTICFIQ